jgi:pimeloyl-ACP methyl ester carboxylesterase
MRALAGDVAAVLDTALADRAFVVGISLGGMIAQEVALQHPDRVCGLVLLATSPGLPHARIPRPRTLLTLLSLPFRRDNGALSRLLLAKKHLGRARELLADWPMAMAAEPTSVSAFMSQLAAAATHSTGSRLGRVRCATIVITGDDDALIHPKNSHFLAARIPGAVLEVLPDVGHAIPVVDEDVVARALQKIATFTSRAVNNSTRDPCTRRAGHPR